ncbi:hypothetical protein [Sporolactobacillus sp. THM19-2]|uniref:hypothetical protein n=1 Tax=Sporolactobacillus sp. THM19-2 TaxID=2511171 RepID=UPI00197E07E8|nr:hypothetical protein [Sporolactobacillus sp. THM19-2]
MTSNEWFILITGITAYLIFFLLPKRFTRPQTLVMLLISVYFVSLFDYTLCIEPFNYYDVNDSGQHGPWDFLSHVMYAPFAYFFNYGYSLIKKRRWTAMIYILVWAVFSLFAEALSWHAKVYHYRNGYQMYYSLVVYLFVLSLTMLYHYCFIQSRAGEVNPGPPAGLQDPSRFR